MIIEVLDGSDIVLVRVVTSEPDIEVVTYGGVSWREYIQPDIERISVLRDNKIEQTKAEGLRRISEIVPAISTIEMVNLILELWPMLNTGSASADMILVKDIYVYARARIGAAESATEAQLNAYDPTTDTGWPT